MKSDLFKIFFNFSLFFIVAIFSSCQSQSNQAVKIRIVDLNGKSHPVIMRTPEMNSQALSSQKIVLANQNSSNISQREEAQVTKSLPKKNSLTQEKDEFADISSRSIRETLQMEPQPKNEIFSQNQNQSLPKYKGQQDQPKYSLDTSDKKFSTALNNSDENRVLDKEYDLSKTSADITTRSPGAQNNTKIFNKNIQESREVFVVKGSKNSTKKFFVQVGSFMNEASAHDALSEVKKFHSGRVSQVSRGEKKVYRAVIGPFKNKIEAEKTLQKLTKSGHEAILVKE
jgi:cell division protein FtsN